MIKSLLLILALAIVTSSFACPRIKEGGRRPATFGEGCIKEGG